MKEIVVISGKGGTGKTSLTAAFASLAGRAVFADCDVDAADLHLLLRPVKTEETVFFSGNEAVIRPDDCTACGLCSRNCRYGAVYENSENGKYRIDPLFCEGCMVCVESCPVKAIDFPERECGSWMLSETRFGALIHARLNASGENSGKLVSLVRKEARAVAEKEGAALILTDGPPGVGCPVIASLTGSDGAIVITEPTVSGKHDLFRVLKLIRHFDIRPFLLINKWDINGAMADAIEREAREQGAEILGRIPYDPDFTAAQMEGKSLPERGRTPVTDQIKIIWENLCQMM